VVAFVSERDAAALLEVVAELDRLDDPLAFPPRFLARLASLLHNPQAAYSVLDRRNERNVAYVNWSEGEEIVENGGSIADAYWRLWRSHPLCGHREAASEWLTPHTVSEFASQREFRRTAIWNELYRFEGVNWWLDIGLEPEHDSTRVFIFVRDRHDFTERDKRVLALLAPHLDRRARAVAAAAEAADALTRVEEASEEVHDVVLLGRGGTIEFASRHARALLRRYAGVTNGSLPAALRSDVVIPDDDGRRLTIRAAPVGELIVLLLAEEDARAERLTPRQRDVLAAVAAGLTDVQIADRLGVAPATVGKHLEGIYERLDVHTRTAAAAVYRR
jgi:DNA-binding CsgD family transcriptional regulator